jgi:hypothetical protein
MWPSRSRPPSSSAGGQQPKNPARDDGLSRTGVSIGGVIRARLPDAEGHSLERAYSGFHSTGAGRLAPSGCLIFKTMPVQMRFRTDSSWIAEQKAIGAEFQQFGDWPTREIWDATPPAQPGDTWRIRWGGNQWPEGQGPIAGYDICCIKCKRNHAWTTATNCEPRVPWSVSWTDPETGETRTSSGTKCLHSGVGSCWQWTGSAEGNTLHASPSLWSVLEKGGCGYHGFLQNGILSDG